MITAALLGNPNVGKTTLYNALTGSNQYVGNWAGVTVEKKEGFIDNKIKIVDLPGIYAMDTYSNEEKVSKDFLQNGNVDVIINIVDASSLDRNLYLTTQLKQFNKPIILVLNMVDVAIAKGLDINYELLSQKLGVTVIPIIASKNKGISDVRDCLLKEDYITNSSNSLKFKDEKETYAYIEVLLKSITNKKSDNKVSISEKIDKVVLNRIIAYPLFFGSLFLIFMFTFSWVGQPLADFLDTLLNDSFVPFLKNLLASNSPWFSSLLIDGIVGGVGSVIVFLPVILALFLGISFLEDSGYMARAAFIMDKLMRKMGLSGKAFIPLIVGFGCSVPAIMSARTLESEKDRKLTALLVPLMSCNARLPVYALFASVFFPGKQTIVVFSLYLMGITLAFGIGILFKHTLFKKDEEPFIIELPEYKLPEPKSLLIHTWEKGKGFLKKAGTIIFSISVIVWFLSNFNTTGMVGINSSFLAAIGKFINPIFIPLGFGSWQNSIALLTGLMAKEVVVGTMGVIYGSNLTHVLPNFFTPLSAYSFLAFVLLYTPCVSVIATMKKEYGNRMAIFSVAYQLILAWVVSFIIFNVGSIIIR
ncbi:ferrous iron transport protein B [Clostridium tagluense]|uniref:ferrous iron transport protein B n=1 Tax=Clostridium tagluense TaxID=360422 RepID=UPI001C6E5B30|nr:ferrous iron transport protein B [Clostridium tagluense]MBW9155220.1 ferrous iron transport protein B [Clostridium tagluense]WLC64653.1 ferrous iron transport protein B [Clostridium tagluense]